MRSYQWVSVKVGAGADEYCLVSSAAEKALGANSAPGASVGGGGGKAGGPCGEAAGDVGGCGGPGCGLDGRCMFAVGGGAIPVREPGAGAGF